MVDTKNELLATLNASGATPIPALASTLGFTSRHVSRLIGEMQNYDLIVVSGATARRRLVWLSEKGAAAAAALGGPGRKIERESLDSAIAAYNREGIGLGDLRQAAIAKRAGVARETVNRKLQSWNSVQTWSSDEARPNRSKVGGAVQRGLRNAIFAIPLDERDDWTIEGRPVAWVTVQPGGRLPSNLIIRK